MKGGPATLKAAKAKLTRRKNLVKKAHKEIFELRELLKVAENSGRKAEKDRDDAEFELEVLKRKTNVEEIFWRFPHLGKNILEELDDESLVKCREVNKWWQEFVDGQKTSYVRNITKCIGLSKMTLQKKLQKENLKMLKEVSHLASCNYYTPSFEGPHRKSNILFDLFCKSKSGHSLGMDYISKFVLPKSLYLCELIIDNSEDKNPVNKRGYNTLHNAAIINNPHMYQLIMGKNIDKNPIHTKWGNAPLHEAAKNNHIEVCKVILGGIQDWNPKDKYGETPYDIAKKKGYKNICELFESAHPKERSNKKRRLD